MMIRRNDFIAIGVGLAVAAARAPCRFVRTRPKSLARAKHRNVSREDDVLVDHRTYRVKPGKMQAHLEMYEQHGFPAQTGISASRSPT